MLDAVKDYLGGMGYKVNTDARDIITKADEYYRMADTDDHHYVTVNGVSKQYYKSGFAKRCAADDANLCEVLKLTAGKNNELIQRVFEENNFTVMFRKQLELTSAEGTAAVYVWLDKADVMTDGTVKGGKIRLNYIDALGYIPLTIENNRVIEAAFWGTDYVSTSEIGTLVIYTRNDTGRYVCTTVKFDEDEAVSEQTETELGEVCPFAIMRTAEVNTLANMEGYGYPKVFGCIPYFLALDIALTSFITDLVTSPAKTLVNERICGFSDSGEAITPNKQMKDEFVFLGESLPDQNSVVQTIQTEIRSEQFKKATELIFGMLSAKFGYGTRKYTFDNRGEIITATQYIGERQDAMQELNKQRGEAEKYIADIVNAVLWFAETYQSEHVTYDEDISVEFDDSYIESRYDRLESYRLDVVEGIGGIYLLVRYLMEKYSITEEEAMKWAQAGEEEKYKAEEPQENREPIEEETEKPEDEKKTEETIKEEVPLPENVTKAQSENK